MRPLRFLIALLAFLSAFLLLVFVAPRHSTHSQQPLEQGTGGPIAAYFNWRTTSSLFPPSAIISITDDNSTNFVARPAAFGPSLPAKSLSGQLWIGSGFGDDRFGRGDGELGCSDVPGWDDGSWTTSLLGSGRKYTSDGKISAMDASASSKNKRRPFEDQDYDHELEDDGKQLSEDDGTDDYLHHPLSASDGLRTNGEAAGITKKPTHADIQSLQESAEIAGKVVLLSRGGCGFLEKVKWAQRRGGIALIVGDDVRGGQLVTMYARGDTSNVTIPSLFTSHTTAQLLSSLMPSGNLLYTEDAARLGFATGSNVKNYDNAGWNKIVADKPVFTTTTERRRSSFTAPAKFNDKTGKNSQPRRSPEQKSRTNRGWFASLFTGGMDNSHDSHRPPSSGHIGWVLQEDFDDEEYIRGKTRKIPPTLTSPQTLFATPNKGPSDGFQIGVQDWRDPDLVAEQREQLLRSSSSSSSSSPATKNSNSAPTALKGGSITPGSGEYANANHELADLSSWGSSRSKDSIASHGKPDREHGSRGWLARLFSLSSHPGQDTDTETESAGVKAASKAAALASKQANSEGFSQHQHVTDEAQMHEGLWVTLSPASMSTSPFFDTLLVLVVSPLVTLTFVYALLLLRSRIRRRRWRAPKSVVEQLPIRTYQTMPSGSNSSTSSVASAADATTPLLPATSRPISTRARPRARTTSEVAHASSIRSDGMASPSLEQVEEKRAAGLAEWRRRYGGRQKECVVCLEDYVDGVSRVMSLPCGHEFHVECITPWLTTRRRTCPICKSDVVRSLARGVGTSSASPTMRHYHDHDEEDEYNIQEQAALTTNEDPAAQQPVSRETEAFEDLERGVAVVSAEEPDRTR